jgi:hypothetical protein
MEGAPAQMFSNPSITLSHSVVHRKWVVRRKNHKNIRIFFFFFFVCFGGQIKNYETKKEKNHVEIDRHMLVRELYGKLILSEKKKN